jgi:hypothetical protein
MVNYLFKTHNGEGEQTVRGAGVPPSPRAERGGRGVRFSEIGAGASELNLSVVPLSVSQGERGVGRVCAGAGGGERVGGGV